MSQRVELCSELVAMPHCPGLHTGKTNLSTMDLNMQKLAESERLGCWMLNTEGLDNHRPAPGERCRPGHVIDALEQFRTLDRPGAIVPTAHLTTNSAK